MEKIVINIIPMKDQCYTTGGYWQFDENGNLEILISQTIDPDMAMPVIMHELIEAFWCKRNGITTQRADEFDDYYETMYREGTVSVDKDAGDDPRCPYREGHQHGKILELLTCGMLDIDWKRYCDAFEQLYSEKIEHEKNT